MVLPWKLPVPWYYHGNYQSRGITMETTSPVVLPWKLPVPWYYHGNYQSHGITMETTSHMVLPWKLPVPWYYHGIYQSHGITMETTSPMVLSRILLIVQFIQMKTVLFSHQYSVLVTRVTLMIRNQRQTFILSISSNKSDINYWHVLCGHEGKQEAHYWQ